MAVNATAVYRVRAGGNNVNGGGYDASITNAINTTLSASLTNGATSMSLTSLTNLPTSGSYYLRLGATGAETTAGLSEVVLVTGAASNPLTIARGQLGTTQNAGTWASGTVVDNDCSRCNTAVASGTTGAEVQNVATFTDVSGAFNTAMVGMALWLASGTNFTVGAYFITAVASATSLTLDRAAATAGAGALGVYKIGGAWADYRTNVSTTYIVPGNIVYIRGAGSDNPGTTADYTVATGTLAAGGTSTGWVYYTGEFGRPALKGSTNTICTVNANSLNNLCLLGAAAGATAMVIESLNLSVYNNVLFDRNGFDQTIISSSGQPIVFIGCEVKSSSAEGATSNAPLSLGAGVFNIQDSNIHDLSAGLTCGATTYSIVDTIFSNLGIDSLTLSGAAGNTKIVRGNTFDAGLGHGIIFTTAAGSISGVELYNNIFSNFNQASKYAINGSFNALALNDRLKSMINYNTFYNNTANYNAITAGANDTQLTADPYVSQSTQNYTLISSAAQALLGAGYPNAAYPQHSAGKTGPRSYVTPGAIAPNIAVVVMGRAQSTPIIENDEVPARRTTTSVGPASVVVINKTRSVEVEAPQEMPARHTATIVIPSPPIVNRVTNVYQTLEGGLDAP